MGAESGPSIDWEEVLNEQVQQSLHTAQETAGRCGCPSCHKAAAGAEQRARDLDTFSGGGVDDLNPQTRTDNDTSIQRAINNFYENFTGDYYDAGWGE